MISLYYIYNIFIIICYKICNIIYLNYLFIFFIHFIISIFIINCHCNCNRICNINCNYLFFTFILFIFIINCINFNIIIIMTCAIIGFIISYLFVKLTVGNSVDINGKSEFTLTEKLQASFLIFLFAGYWIVLLAKYLISLI